MNAWSIGTLVVIGGTCLAVFGMLWVRKTIALTHLQSHHEVAGYLLSVIGTLYAVLLGLVVVDVQSKYQQAQLMAEAEANSVADLFHLAAAFPAEQKALMQGNLLSYVDAVIDKEWNRRAIRYIDDGSVIPLRNVWNGMSQYEPKTNRQQACYSAFLQTLAELSDSRRFRVVTTRAGVSPVLWGVLIAGGITTVLFTYFFGVKDVRAQILMTSLVAFSISLNVLLVVLFSNPYEGELKIRPEGFLYDQKIMRLQLKQAQALPPSAVSR